MHNIRKGCCICRKYLRTRHIYIQQTKGFCDYAITPYSKNKCWALVSMISYFVDPFHVLRMPVFVRSVSRSYEIWFINEIIMKISKTTVLILYIFILKTSCFLCCVVAMAQLCLRAAFEPSDTILSLASIINVTEPYIICCITYSSVELCGIVCGIMAIPNS